MDKRNKQDVVIDKANCSLNSFNFSSSSASSSLTVYDRLAEDENRMRNYINIIRKYKSTAMIIDIEYNSSNNEIDDLISYLIKAINEKLSNLMNEIEYQQQDLFGITIKNRDDLKLILQESNELKN